MGGMNFKARLLIPFVLTLIVLLGAFIYHTVNYEQQKIDTASDRLIASALELFKTQMASDFGTLTVAIMSISKNRELADLMIRGERDALLLAVKPIFSKLNKNHNVTQLHFQKPDRTNFLRVHRPETYGDLVNRYTTLKAEETQDLFYGIEVDRFGQLTLRVVLPWIVDGELIGYLELGEDTANIVDNIQSTLGVDYVLTIDKSLISRSDWEEGVKTIDRNSGWDTLPDSVITSMSMDKVHPHLKFALVEGDKKSPGIKTGIKHFRYKEEMSKRQYYVDAVRLSDVSGKNVASLYTIWDISSVVASSTAYILTVITISLIAGVFLFVLFYIILNRVEKELSFFHKSSLDASNADNARLAAAVEQTAEVVVVTDKDGIIEYVNPAFERVTGYRRSEALGKTPTILASGKHDKLFYQSLWNTICAGDVWKGRFINKKKDGSLFDSDCVISPVRGKNGSIVNYVSLQRDVTQELKLEQKLQASQKMEAIGTLAGGIAHDFNNILTGIIGYTELAHDDLKIGEAKENLEAALKAGSRAKSLIAEILTFSRDGEQALNQIYMQSEVRETLGILRPVIPSTISIRKKIDDSLPSITANRAQMTQLVMNLCTNAEHAMRQNGGVLEIKLGGFEADKDFVSMHEGITEGFYVRLSVSDTGHGMDRKTTDRVFEPFFTTKDVGEGTGMGLSVVHGIVEGHGGVVTVHSEVGMGTTFTVYLPARGHMATMTNEAEFLVRAGDGERILYVDDEESIAIMVERSLSRLGYSVVAVSDPREALDLFSRAPDSFDLVLTDQTMPVMTGVELARKIMRIRPDTPVVLCTGYSHTVNEQIASEMGISDFVMKPISKSVLSRVIRKTLDEANKAGS